MGQRFPISLSLPPDADAAIAIVQRLHRAGFAALLAGGCVRDLLLHQPPSDYDVATDARPERIQALFQSTRLVGVQFGVVLVKSRGRWVEVATFRSEGAYLDGRRPSSVQFGDAEGDALRRDFTINGLFLDTRTGEVVDYVGGVADLRAGVLRAIGDADQRFAEDYLRLLRAVRFGARLGFALDAATRAAIQNHAGRLSQVAPERVRDELERMLAAATRTAAFDLLCALGLMPHMWPDFRMTAEQLQRAGRLVRGLPTDATFEAAFAVIVAELDAAEIERITRALAFSNPQRGAVLFIHASQRDLDDPAAISLAALKRLMANSSFEALRMVLAARVNAGLAPADAVEKLARRMRDIPAESIAPPPFISGADLLERGVPVGPIYRRVLDRLYTMQLDETIADRSAALDALRELLREEGL